MHFIYAMRCYSCSTNNLLKVARRLTSELAPSPSHESEEFPTGRRALAWQHTDALSARLLRGCVLVCLVLTFSWLVGAFSRRRIRVRYVSLNRQRVSGVRFVCACACSRRAQREQQWYHSTDNQPSNQQNTQHIFNIVWVFQSIL